MVKTYGKLREKIKQIFGTLERFADAMDMHPSTLSAKLNSRSPWTAPEIEKACLLLHIGVHESGEYFFY